MRDRETRIEEKEEKEEGIEDMYREGRKKD